MKVVLVLAVVAAVAWYFQQQAKPGAGASAAAQARRLRSPLVRLADLAGIETARSRQAGNWAVGAEEEKATAARLAPLAREGWTLLHDCALPGTRANADHIAISPSGVVFNVDSKRRTARYPLRVTGGRLMQHDSDVTHWLRGTRHETRLIAAQLDCPVISVVSMKGPQLQGGDLVVDGIRIVEADHLVPVLRSLGRRHRAVGEHPGRRAAALFPSYRRK
ncbi:nuclease-related domain-containing protein [Streptomyces goshikiensis]|uniref:nuclease-related domain-containing protein n=1 Tax=Streptomyces goshikiensis TaxID=1942 RepID=UPI003659FEEF